MRDPNTCLGVSPSATPDLIKSAYRKKATQYHPDKNPSPDAAARFRDVQEAYEVLSDTKRRQEYDALRQRRLIDDPLPVAREIAAHYLQGVLS